MKKTILSLLIISIGVSTNSLADSKFCTVLGLRASYSLEIPCDYKLQNSIGKNVDLRYADLQGASVVMVVKQLATNTPDNQIRQFENISIKELRYSIEANGVENVKISKTGFLTINGRLSYFMSLASESLKK